MILTTMMALSLTTVAGDGIAARRYAHPPMRMTGRSADLAQPPAAPPAPAAGSRVTSSENAYRDAIMSQSRPAVPAVPIVRPDVTQSILLKYVCANRANGLVGSARVACPVVK